MVNLEMMKFLGFLFMLASAGASLRPRGRSVTCRVMYMEVFMAKGGNNRLECEIVSGGTVGHSFGVKLSSKLVAKHRDVMMKGDWFIRIPGAQVEETHIRGYGMIGSALNIPNQTNITTLPASVGGRRRSLMGTVSRTLMVARVSVEDSSPTYSSDQLQKWYFDPDSFSVARQFARCSSGQLVFVNGTTPVMDLSISGNIASFTQTTLVNAAVTALQNATGGPSLPVQHIAFVLPPGLSSPFIAVGQVGGWRTTFYNTFGGIPNTVMHELGHNLGLGHAGVPGDEYGDFTSIMGYGELSQFYPSKCFNGCDHLNFGWFADRTVVVDPSLGQQTANLASFVDYNWTSSSQPVVLKIGDYGISYNKAKGVNFQAEVAASQVTVAICDVQRNSTRLSILDETSAPFTQPNYNGSSQQLVIQVCSRITGATGLSGTVDYAIVAIGLGSASCGAPVPVVPAPSPFPVQSPTIAPLATANPSERTEFPTFSLETPAPTITTPGPSFLPTPSPSAVPPPTPLPTPRPTRKPTRRPSRKPATRKPTSWPTWGPTYAPTRKPSSPPTRKPRSARTKRPTLAPVTVAPFSVFISAGSQTAFAASDGVVWSADSYFSGNNTVVQSDIPISNTPDAVLYQTQRLGPIQYNIPVPRISNYKVTMLFAEIDPRAHARGARTFDILFEGLVAYRNFDIFSAAGGGFKAVSLVPVVVVIDGNLNITFSKKVNDPLLAAIEVVAV